MTAVFSIIPMENLKKKNDQGLKRYNLIYINKY